MIPTPEAITKHLREEIRRGSESLQREGQHRGRLFRVRRRWRQLRHTIETDRIGLVLVVVLVVSGVAAFGFLASAWPLGGMDQPSQVVIAQGASLVFIVILVALLTPAVEAGRSIGWDASWIRRDRPIWSALGAVAAISLFDLWLGSSGPDRHEEIATILLTASGLALIGLAGRRAIALADPATQLAERRKQESVLIAKLVGASSAHSRGAMSSAGVEPGVAEQISQIPSQRVQVAVRESVRRILATSRGAWQRGEWMLAAQAHAQAIILALEYAEASEALAPEDLVFELIRNETDDLHEVADGPQGRWFSLTLLQNLIECGIAVVSMQKSSMPHQNADSLAYYFAMDINKMVERRLFDPKSPDVNAGVDGLKRLALAEWRVAHAWGAASIGELGLKWAPIGVGARLPHLAWPAWSCGIAVLRSLSRSDDGTVDPLSWRSLAEKFVDAVRQIQEIPSGITNGFEPIVGHWIGDATVLGLAYELWQADVALLDEVGSFTIGIHHQLVRLANDSDDQDRWGNSKNCADAIYHLTAAAAMRADQSEVGDPERAWATEVVCSGLLAIRGIIFDEAGVPKQSALRDLLHIYLSTWQLTLYLEDQSQDLSDSLVGEATALVEALTVEAVAEMPADLTREGLSSLADWLGRYGASAPASAVRSIAESVPEPDRGPFPGSTWGWGMMGGPYRLYRGSMIVPFIDRVERSFEQDLTNDS